MKLGRGSVKGSSRVASAPSPAALLPLDSPAKDTEGSRRPTLTLRRQRRGHRRRDSRRSLPSHQSTTPSSSHTAMAATCVSTSFGRDRAPGELTASRPQPVPPASSLLADSLSPRLHYLLTGTFNTLFLYLLAFSPYSSNGPTLTVHRRVRGQGPHQFVALNEERDRAYATTWAQPPTLSSWEVLKGGRGGVRKINTVPICASAPVPVPELLRRADFSSGPLVPTSQPRQGPT